MVGALNKLPVALSGLIFFPQERNALNFGYVISILIAFTAGMIYSYAQVLKKKKLQQLDNEDLQQPDTRVAPVETIQKVSIIEMLNEYESRLGLKATYHELKPKTQYK